MRVVGLIVIVLAGSAWADERSASSLLRFAYAGPLATSLPQDADAASESADSELRLLSFVSAERLLDQPIKTARTETTIPKTFRPAHGRNKLAVGAKSIEPIAPVREIPLLPVPRPQTQRLAALSEPMHLLSDAPPVSIVASEKQPVAASPQKQAAPARKRTSRRASRVRTAPPPPPDESATKPWKVPRWAEKMFDSSWQRRAFAYQ